MSLTIKHRYQPINFFSVAVVFFASFSLSFVVGSLAFIPYDSMAEEFVDELGIPAIALAVSSTQLNMPDSDTFSITEFVETTDNIDIEVNTNNPIGFNLSMSIVNSTTGLTHSNGVTTIPSTSNLSPGTLDINTWGYNIGGNATTFRRVPGLGSQVTLANTTSPAKSSATTVTIGAKADTTFPAGSYSSTLRFTAVAH